jgi:hypothetical protein
MVAPTIDFLGSVFWQFTTFIVAIVAVIGFLVYRYYLEPPISRWFMSAKWSKEPVGFIQDDANVVHLVKSKAALPEGIIHTARGFFLKGRAPYIPDEIESNVSGESVKRGPGRPRKIVKEPDVSVDECELVNEGLEVALQTPVLEGFGKAVFFGYDGAPLVSNLKTLALTTNNGVSVKEVEKSLDGSKVYRCIERFVGHADLRIMKEVIPATISRTQLSNLYRWALNKGYEKRGGDQTKLLLTVVIACIPIACLGIVAFLLINGGK